MQNKKKLCSYPSLFNNCVYAVKIIHKAELNFPKIKGGTNVMECINFTHAKILRKHGIRLFIIFRLKK